MNVLFGLNGRIRRSTYLLGSLAHFGLFLVGVGLVIAGFTLEDNALETRLWMGHPAFAVAGVALVLLAFWSGWALAAKRWHDVGVTGWFALLALIPGPHLLLFVLLCLLPGRDGSNAYGPDPRRPAYPPAEMALAA